MSTPTPKQLVVRSLRALHKRKMDLQFKVQALSATRRDLRAQEKDAKVKLAAIEAKLHWELNKHSDVLKDDSTT